MPIYPVNGAFPTGSTALTSASQIDANQAASAANGLDATQGTGDTASASSFGSVIDGLQSLQGQSESLAVKAVTGNADDVHTATIAATRAQVTLELVSAVRSKAVDAFNEIMRMQA
ncbi:flagellar hook-basal body complex protein FliE [Frondihabitans australicus]|uniref:Flagellar hook-basal body complex protein FliE n=1 Tax=Frondihabitans australicus TaxID=386892 RepID=A0A495IIN1_9MICO|nr:flagellar hook-basal body complex protein FliE [Frondihabitans australicus]RKR75570.1 flagellar hook-basal body complex protein FliE [Frondihabitans australicus]